MSAILRLALQAFIALWLACATTTAALAHAELQSSDPAPDAILLGLPESVALEFSEDVGALALSWRLPDGSTADATAEAGAGVLHVTPPPAAGKGSYTLTWRVASADGHPVGGALVFSLDHPSGQRPVSTGDGSAWLAVALRSLTVTALVLCVGAAIYAALVGPIPKDTARILRRAGFAVPVMGLVLIGVEGADRLGSLSFLCTPQGWLSGLTAPVAQAVLLSFLAVALTLPDAARYRRTRTYLAWAITAASFAIAGHARAEPWPLMPLTALHAAAMLFWVGGLPPLTAAVLAAKGPDRAIPLRRFSKLAFPIVVGLIVTGAALSLHRAEAPDVLHTSWAGLLAAKLTFVIALLALAALHRFRTTAQVTTGQATNCAVSLKTETIIGLFVLILAMGFRLAPPPAAEPQHLPMTHFQKGSLMVMLEPSAIPPGLVRFSLQITERTRRDFQPKEVTLSLSDPVAGIGPIKVQAETNGEFWTTPEITIPTGGSWQATITVLISDFDAVKMEGALGKPD